MFCLRDAGRALILSTFGRLILVPILAYVGCLLFGLATFETMIVVVPFSQLPTACLCPNQIFSRG